MGEVSYELFMRNGERKEAKRVYYKFMDNENFPKPIDIFDLVRNIQNGDPTREPMLQYADFMAYPPFIINV